ncbi:hypothetical protein T07_9265 [Trichinella nelsoni]|uniref:Uncharacterized protein n=1 Tax=Trichinella nelsoni TaxID=6336 RepID=A0A0V0RMB1_9BILA|nr:hypothetical protein T07_9265 [Trichinella nelsoni]
MKQITEQCIITKCFFTIIAYNKSGFHVAALDLMRLALFATLHSSVQWQCTVDIADILRQEKFEH